MKERVLVFGGSISISGEAERGTLIQVTLPPDIILEK
jgi:signal transduction histidine kinase